MDITNFVIAWSIQKQRGVFDKADVEDIILSAIEQDREKRGSLSADLVRIQSHWPIFNFYPADGQYHIENIDVDSYTVLYAVYANTPEAAVAAALKEIGP